MITPIEIQSKTFKSGGLGYDKKDVDAFFREVLLSYEQIYRQNMEMKDKISVLTEGIQYYKTIEKTLQKALVLAEKTAEDTKAQALVTAKNIENEAMTRSQLIVADAKNELEHIHAQTIQLIQQYEKYKVQFKNLAAAQIELIESDCFDISLAKLDTFVQLEKKETKGKESMVAHRKDPKQLKKARKPEALSVRENTTVSQPMEQAEDEFLDALGEVSASSEELALKEYKAFQMETNANQGAGNEEHQEEFSFINLEDDED